MPPRLLYTLDRERTYHFVTCVLFTSATMTVGLVSLLPPEPPLAETDAIGARRWLQAALLLIGAGPLPAWCWWMRRYVRRLTWRPDEKALVIERCGFFARPWIVRRAELESTTAHPGGANFPGAPVVRAPYQTIRLRNRPALILDDQGTVHDASTLESILAGDDPVA